jgi:hypothetical protein
MGAPGFTVDVFHNEHLPGGAREVNAIVTVTSAQQALYAWQVGVWRCGYRPAWPSMCPGTC